MHELLDIYCERTAPGLWHEPLNTLTDLGFPIPGRRPYVTQPCVAGDPRNVSDFLYRRIPAERRHLVTSEFLPIGDDSPALTARFDIIQGGAPGLCYDRRTDGCQIGSGVPLWSDDFLQRRATALEWTFSPARRLPDPARRGSQARAICHSEAHVRDRHIQVM